MSKPDSTIICKAIGRCLSNPSEKNVSAVTKHFWHLPDGDDAEAARFIVYGIRALARRGKPITRESLLAYLRYETFMASPCRKLLDEIQ